MNNYSKSIKINFHVGANTWTFFITFNDRTILIYAPMNNFIQHSTRHYWKREKSPTLQKMTEIMTGHLHPGVLKMTFIIVINTRMNHLILSVYANLQHLLKRTEFAYICGTVFCVQWHVRGINIVSHFCFAVLFCISIAG